MFFGFPSYLCRRTKKSVSDFPFLVWRALVNLNQETKKKAVHAQMGRNASLFIIP